MTIRLPPDNFIDHILAILGKKASDLSAWTLRLPEELPPFAKVQNFYWGYIMKKLFSKK